MDLNQLDPLSARDSNSESPFGGAKHDRLNFEGVTHFLRRLAHRSSPGHSNSNSIRRLNLEKAVQLRLRSWRRRKWRRRKWTDQADLCFARAWRTAGDAGFGKAFSV